MDIELQLRLVPLLFVAYIPYYLMSHVALSPAWLSVQTIQSYNNQGTVLGNSVI
jgi:hypothetical protein